MPFYWDDVTADLAGDEVPITLARPDGVGALQFSIMLYRSGQTPNPSPDDLLTMISGFARDTDLGEVTQTETEFGPPVLAAGTCYTDGDYVRIWVVSDGMNFAFVTYTCASDHGTGEVRDCEQIVRSLVFT
ncbi:hypothetical protein [Neorhodopirellula pilleata]|uniref:hypothetical protein n=1 Tax=Neorhodopirellula pilleata TaxID=2714738 RepID=UPI0011B4D08B|nr:hypothetical protein [Neorhodopirellula pilleata]